MISSLRRTRNLLVPRLLSGQVAIRKDESQANETSLPCAANEG
jgi:hypothetical protein